MTTTCERIDDRAAELAFGVVAEPERTELLAHVDECDRCRRLVDDLSTTADQIVLAAPEIEPPVGFESRAVATMGVTSDSQQRIDADRRRSWRTAAVALVAAIAAVVGGVAVERSVSGSSAVDAEVSVQGSGALQTQDGSVVGQATVIDGPDPVMVMSLDVAEVGERYDCTLVYADGSTEDIGTWAPRGPNHTWSVPLDPPAVSATQLVVADSDGSSVATASLT